MAKQAKRSSEIKNGNSRYFNLDEEKAFFEEVDEEVRNEKFKQLINKYGGYILTLLTLAIVFAVGYEKVGEWQNRRAEQKTAQYFQAINPYAEYEQSIAELEAIVNTENSLYKDIAQLQIANILLENNQEERALRVLEKISKDDTISNKIREIAIVKLATYKVDTVSLSEMETLLNPVIQNENAWTPMAKELLAMSAIQNKDFARGKSIYEELLKNEKISDEFRARINDMLASINEAN